MGAITFTDTSGYQNSAPGIKRRGVPSRIIFPPSRKSPPQKSKNEGVRRCAALTGGGAESIPQL